MILSKRFAPEVALLFSLAVLGTAAPPAACIEEKPAGPVRNVIVMVPDGCGSSVPAIARWVKGGPLRLDGLTTGVVKTFMANSVVPDSAAAATAFATGHKTTGGFIGVGPRTGDLLTGLSPTAAPYVPVASVLEGARLKKMATGLVATSRVTHATPAAFAAHVDHRDRENEIMEQMVYQNVDVVLGGGARHLIPAGENYRTGFGADWAGARSDGENLIEALSARGYAFVDNKTDLMALAGGRVWGLFAAGDLDPDIDRDDLHPTQPSLAQMTEKAIALLSKNPGGFFLMVEGSQIDWAAHANDPAYLATEFLAFDKAVGEALSFAKKDRHTLVLIFADHGTGGPVIGKQTAGFSTAYGKMTAESLADPIRGATVTVATLAGRYFGDTPEKIRVAFVRHWGEYWRRMSDKQARDLLRIKSDANALARYISETFTAVRWTTRGHTGGDVPLWAFGPGRPVGAFDHTELAEVVEDALGIDLASVSARLFVDAAVVFPHLEVDQSDPLNPVLKTNGWQLPVSKDIARKNGREKRLGGIVVHAPAIDRYFVPGRAATMLRLR